jgi:hypothetical protein
MTMNEMTVRCEDCRKKVKLAATVSVFPKDKDGEETHKTVCNACAQKYKPSQRG